MSSRKELVMKTTVEKYHGLGNDYLVFDPNCNSLHLSPEHVRRLCDRNFGVGADGGPAGPRSAAERNGVRIWAPAGSIAEDSGNGVRIFAKYLKGGRYVQKKKFSLHMGGGEVFGHYLNEEGSRLKVSMG